MLFGKIQKRLTTVLIEIEHLLVSNPPFFETTFSERGTPERDKNSRDADRRSDSPVQLDRLPDHHFGFAGQSNHIESERVETVLMTEVERANDFFIGHATVQNLGPELWLFGNCRDRQPVMHLFCGKIAWRMTAYVKNHGNSQ